mgnify:FL=1
MNKSKRMSSKKSNFKFREKVDTYEIIYKMTNSINGLAKGNLSRTAEIYGTSRNRLSDILKRRVSPPTLDTLCIWINNLYVKTGVRVVITLTPDFKTYYTIVDARKNKIEGIIEKTKT